ncbi:MAG: tetratricopeptide repeat protein [Verrucomicrobiales bacterium]
MKASVSTAAILLAITSLAVSISSLSRRGQTAAAPSETTGKLPRVALDSSGAEDLDARISTLEQQLGLRGETAGDRPQSDGAARDVGARLDAIEASLAKLTQAFEGISLESASEERDALFRSEDGYLKADEYFAAGKFAIAAEGYLAFLESNPEHPQAYDILKRARQAFTRAGYSDKAVWAQQELLRNLGEDRRAEDVMTLAQLEKDAGSLDSAIDHAAEAADRATDVGSRLWNRMYWAWYNQLRDGDSAGLNAYREVQREIDAAGQGGEKVGIRVREKIEEIERAQAGRSTTVSE